MHHQIYTVDRIPRPLFSIVLIAVDNILQQSFSILFFLTVASVFDAFLINFNYLLQFIAVKFIHQLH